LDIKFDLNKSLYLRDPQDTELGKKIIGEGILLLDNIGFESFNFKKLANQISSTEKTIYRYFENKHFFLLFIASWYWEWVYYLIQINIKNVTKPDRKLKIAIRNLVLATTENPMNKYINENVLHKVVIKEGGKAYHICTVDEENKAGLFFSYKHLVKLVADIIEEVNPAFEYNLSLSSNLFEMANNQIYFAEHLPKLTSLTAGEKLNEDLIEMLCLFSLRILGKSEELI